MIKAVFFDFSGVICEEGLSHGVERYEKEFNIPQGKFYNVIHNGHWKKFTLGQITEREYLDQCRERSKGMPFDEKRFVSIMEESAAPKRDVIKYVKELSKKYIIGIISNNPKEWFDRFLKNIGLTAEVKVLAISGYEHVRKPDKAMYEIALKKAGVNGEEVISVDDRPDKTAGAVARARKVVIFKNVDDLKNQIEILSN
jgi:HAD superfamily hydrolase (TIGR01509 family)